MDKVVVITGAGHHLGKAFAIGLSRQGYNIVATGQTQAELDELASRLAGDFMTMVCDITKPEMCEAVMQAAKEKYGKVDVVVNNAGVYTGDSFVDAKPSMVKLVFDVVVAGTASVSKAALEVMKETRSGQIINILDVTSREGLPELKAGASHAVDASAKRAKVELTNMLRQEAAQYNVAVTSFFMRWVASSLDYDDATEPPAKATHPRDAVAYLQKAIEETHKETILPSSREIHSGN